jgi:transposase-like protein
MSESMSTEIMPTGLSVVQSKEKVVIGRRVPGDVRVEAVRRVTEGQESVVDVAKDMGFSTSAIHNWRREHMKALKDDSENGRLKERVRELEGLLKAKDEELFKLRHEVKISHRYRSELVQEIIKNR